MNAKRLKTAALNIYIAPELKAAAEKTAAADNRSLTSLVEKLLTDAARKAGFWPERGKDERGDVSTAKPAQRGRKL